MAESICKLGSCVRGWVHEWDLFHLRGTIPPAPLPSSSHVVGTTSCRAYPVNASSLQMQHHLHLLIVPCFPTVHTLALLPTASRDIYLKTQCIYEGLCYTSAMNLYRMHVRPRGTALICLKWQKINMAIYYCIWKLESIFLNSASCFFFLTRQMGWKQWVHWGVERQPTEWKIKDQKFTFANLHFKY